MDTISGEAILSFLSLPLFAVGQFFKTNLLPRRKYLRLVLDPYLDEEENKKS